MGRRTRREEAPLSLFSFQDIMACLTGILILVALLLAIDGLSDAMQATPGRPAAEASAAERLPSLRERVALLQRAIDDRSGGRDVSKAEVDILDDRVSQLAMEAERARTRRTELDAASERMRTERTEADRRAEELRASADQAARLEREAELRERVRFRPGMRYPKSPVFIEPMAGGVAVGELDASRTPVRIADLRDPGADARIVGALGKRLPDTSYLVFVVHEDAIPRFEQLRSRMLKRGYEVGWQLWQGEPASMLDGAAESGGQVPLEVPGAPPANGGNP